MSDIIKRKDSFQLSIRSERDTSQAPDPILIWDDLRVKRPATGVKKAVSKLKKSYHEGLEEDVPMTPTGSDFLLRNADGYALPGEVLAIVGPSGCGKTTMLKAISGQIKRSGAVFYKKKLVSGSMLKYVGMVNQESHFISALTVHETLLFNAHLRIPNASLEQIEEKIEQLLLDFSLEHTKNTKIGEGEEAGLSGGEKRRLAIAIELLSNPDLIFLDEPTSGLDAAEAFSVMKVLKKLSRNHGTTVVLVIHQARLEIFEETVDRILVMGKGTPIFLGSFTEGIACFEDAMKAPFKLNDNPADLMLDILKRNPDIQDTIKGVYQIKYARAIHLPDQRTLSITDGPKEREMTSRRIQLDVLVKRTRIIAGREQIAYAFGVQLFFAILTGLIYRQNELTTGNIHDRFLMLGMMTAFGSMSGVCHLFLIAKERSLFLHERRLNLYTTTSYYFSKFIYDIPITTGLAAMVACTVYTLCRMGPDTFDIGNFMVFFGFVFLDLISAASVGAFFGALCRGRTLVGVEMNDLYNIISLMVSGTFASLRNVSVFVRGLSYLSYTRYVYLPLIVNEATSRTIHCATEHIMTNTTCQATTEVDFYLEQAGVQMADASSYIVHNAVILISLNVAMRVVTYLLLQNDK
jgi:ABC-type multidrug transport system ATPase subunit